MGLAGVSALAIDANLTALAPLSESSMAGKGPDEMRPVCRPSPPRGHWAMPHRREALRLGVRHPQGLLPESLSWPLGPGASEEWKVAPTLKKQVQAQRTGWWLPGGRGREEGRSGRLGSADVSFYIESG